MRIQTERELLERSSDQLRALQDGLREVDASIKAREGELGQCNGELGRLRDRLQECGNRAQARQRQIATYADHALAEKDLAEIVAGLPLLTVTDRWPV